MFCQAWNANTHRLAFHSRTPLQQLPFGNARLGTDTFSQTRRGCLAVNLSELKTAGIKGMILDLDKTLRPYPLFSFFNKPPEIPQPVHQWLEMAKDNDFKLYIISNNLNKHDVEAISKALEIPAIARALKPFSFWHLNKAMKDMGIEKKETVVVGDKSLVDGLFGYLNGLGTILVPPLIRDANS